jgi:site-specific DNA recombinase
MYRQQVAALEQALADPEIKAEAMEIVRSQIERITLTPNAEDGLDVHLYGDLARILQLCEAGERTDKRPRTDVPGRGLSVVAGARSHLYRTCMAWTQPYRLGFLRAEQTCLGNDSIGSS